MSTPVILALFLILLVGVILVMGAFALKRKPPVISPEGIQEYLDYIERRTGFTKPAPLKGDPRGKCLFYTFPTEPTLSVRVVDSLQPTPSSDITDCYDEDQDYLEKQTSTCKREDYCIGPEGEEVSPGKHIIIYNRCDKGVVKPCYEYDESFLAALGLYRGEVCMVREGSDILTYVPCDLGDKNQVFRFTRALPVTLTGNSNGPYLRIYDRDTDMCVAPKRFPPVAGDVLVEGPCSFRKGYYWWVVPGVFFRDVVEGEETTFVSPPQLVYADNTGPLPDNLTDYLGREAERTLSVQPRDGKLVLLPYQINPDTPQGGSSFTEIKKYALYE